ncbi:hypothetical protein CRG98_026051 [Punica granatum]|uniref:Uncharacterized protein n=1 Tax=Punica granatum TaxID=22663 RepID=A0A2I0JBH6_PUNGR|nr:hypothetical protein CRG98_026051 [Punica granatum]
MAEKLLDAAEDVPRDVRKESVKGLESRVTWLNRSKLERRKHPRGAWGEPRVVEAGQATQDDFSKLVWTFLTSKRLLEVAIDG